MYFIDTHCHLNIGALQNEVDLVLQRAVDNSVTRFLVPGVDIESSRQAVDLAEKYESVYAAVGVHPNDGLQWDNNSLAVLKDLSQHPKVVAIGEIGLDFYRDRTPSQVQIEILNIQLSLAMNINKPVIIHCRQAMETLWPVLRSWQESLISSLKFRPGVFHSLDTELIIAKEIISYHYMVGVSGPVTYKNAFDRQATIGSLPLEKLLLETDAPYLSPHPLRGKINEPANIPIIAEKIAEIKNCSLEQVAETTSVNANRLFEWIS